MCSFKFWFQNPLVDSRKIVFRHINYVDDLFQGFDSWFSSAGISHHPQLSTLKIPARYLPGPFDQFLTRIDLVIAIVGDTKSVSPLPIATFLPSKDLVIKSSSSNSRSLVRYKFDKMLIETNSSSPSDFPNSIVRSVVTHAIQKCGC